MMKLAAGNCGFCQECKVRLGSAGGAKKVKIPGPQLVFAALRISRQGRGSFPSSGSCLQDVPGYCAFNETACTEYAGTSMCVEKVDPFCDRPTGVELMDAPLTIW